MQKNTIPSTANGRVPAVLYDADGAHTFTTEEALDAALEDGMVDHPSKVGEKKKVAAKPKMALKPKTQTEDE